MFSHRKKGPSHLKQNGPFCTIRAIPCNSSISSGSQGRGDLFLTYLLPAGGGRQKRAFCENLSSKLGHEVINGDCKKTALALAGKKIALYNNTVKFISIKGKGLHRTLQSQSYRPKMVPSTT